MEQLVILLIIAAISFVNWLMQKSAEHKERRAREKKADSGELIESAQDEDASPAEFDAEAQTRKFLEALGLPTEAEPPRPVERDLAPPPIPSSAQPQPVRRKSFLHKLDPDVEKRLVPEIPDVAVQAKPRFTRTTGSRMRVLPPVEAPPPAAALQLRDLLASKNGLQSAILAREILGPPKGADLNW